MEYMTTHTLCMHTCIYMYAYVYSVWIVCIYDTHMFMYMYIYMCVNTVCLNVYGFEDLEEWI